MKKLILLACSLLLAGCAYSRHMGNENLNPEMTSQLVKGKSTKQDVLTVFGPPQTTQKNLNRITPANMDVKLPAPAIAAETWSYWSHKSEGTAVVLPFYSQTDMKSSNVVISIYFDDAGSVLDYSTTESRF